MISFISFIISGAVIFLLVLAKVWETKRRKPFGLLTIISKGDARLRNLSADSAHLYTELKERGDFFLRKQLPLRTKNLLNKTEAVVKERAERYLGDIRNKGILKPKNEGIAEFFKTVSELEKETAAGLDDSPENLEADSQNEENGVK